MKAEEERTSENRVELAELIASHCKGEGILEAAEGLALVRLSSPTPPHHGLYSPAICVIAQGAKEVQLGDERYRYDPAHYLICALDVPIISQVVEATPEKPYLSLKLNLDPALVASVSIETSVSPKSDNSVRAMNVNELHGDLLDAFVRLVRLLEKPADYMAISPMVLREIIYRLLATDEGPRLRQMAVFGGHTNRIAKAVDTLKTKFDQDLRIEDLARDLGMSVSSFHQHFKTATSMSPLQFQKQLRLQEARRLLLFEGFDASSAAERVGYDDASQFSREYKRLFGDPPTRDLARFKQLSPATRQ